MQLVLNWPWSNLLIFFILLHSCTLFLSLFVGIIAPASFSAVVSGVQRLMTNQLTNVGTFVASALPAFDHRAHLYMIELKVQNATQRVIATEVNMTHFIGVRTFSVAVRCVIV